MSEAIERAVARAGLVCLHLDPAYAPGYAALRTLVTKGEALRVARLAEAAGGVLPLVEDTRLVLLPPAVALDAPDPFTGAPADPAAAAAQARRVALDQGRLIGRLRLAVLILTTCGHGEAQAIVREWFAAGGTTPIPYPAGALFRPWAEAHGVLNVEGFMGFATTPLPATEAGR